MTWDTDCMFPPSLMVRQAGKALRVRAGTQFGRTGAGLGVQWLRVHADSGGASAGPASVSPCLALASPVTLWLGTVLSAGPSLWGPPLPHCLPPSLVNISVNFRGKLLHSKHVFSHLKIRGHRQRACLSLSPRHPQDLRVDPGAPVTGVLTFFHLLPNSFHDYRLAPG